MVTPYISVNMLSLTDIRLNWKKLHNLQNSQFMSNLDDHICMPGINQYFAVGFSVISLVINKLMLEIRMESMRQTQLPLKCEIIIGRLKVSMIVSPKKATQITSCNMWKFKQN